MTPPPQPPQPPQPPGPPNARDLLAAADPLELGRETTGDPVAAESREWLVANGRGGYAMGTVAGSRTRGYHGLLIAALQPPLGRVLLAAKLDVRVRYLARAVSLVDNRWGSGHHESAGSARLERFRLEGSVPLWSYAVADARLERRVWMEPGEDTTFVRWQLTRGSAPLELCAALLVALRDHHALLRENDVRLTHRALPAGLRLGAGGPELTLLAPAATVAPRDGWVRDLLLSLERYRGLDHREDLRHAADLSLTLEPGSSVTVVLSALERPAPVDGALQRRHDHDRARLREAAALLARAEDVPPERERLTLGRLVLAADAFVVARDLPPGGGDEQGGDSERGGVSVVAGYPWFGDWGRDTMIALPGLALTTGRVGIASQILRTYAAVVYRGMIPNRFPDSGEPPEYNTVDATIWFLHAARVTCEALDGLRSGAADALLAELFPAFERIVAAHLAGTRHGIRVDPADGLIAAGEAGVQLTWMDAKAGDWVVTPRIGKPVEVNALWLDALAWLGPAAARVGRPDPAAALLPTARAGFGRFWSARHGHLFDVLDGPDGDDPSLRPNQLLAAGLPATPLSTVQRRAVVDACARALLTSHGLRSLTPDHPAYRPRYGGGVLERDGAYHQGTVWAWPLGAFVDAHLLAYRDPVAARAALRPLLRHLHGGLLGSLGEIADGAPPHTPRGAPAQAWSVAEALRAWQRIHAAAAAGDRSTATGGER